MKRLYFLLLSSLLFACQHKTPTNMELNISIVQLESPVETSLRGISAVDSNIVWLSGSKGSILRTVDGGKSWERLNSPDEDSLDFRDVEAFSKESAIVVSAGYPSRIYKTINGGVNWELVHENLDSNAFMNSVAFRNPQEGIVLGDQLNGRHLILQTNNQGETWQIIDSNHIPPPLPVENGFAASGSCIAIDHNGKYYMALGGEVVRIFTSSNGDHWEANTTPMVSKGPSYGIYSIAFGNETVIGVGGDYQTPDSSHFGVYSSTDQPQWKLTQGQVNGYRSVIDYSIEGNIWVCGGSNGLDISYDNGQKWETFAFENVNTLQFLPGTSKAIAANSKGKILLLTIKTNFGRQ